MRLDIAQALAIQFRGIPISHLQVAYPTTTLDYTSKYHFISLPNDLGINLNFSSLITVFTYYIRLTKLTGRKEGNVLFFEFHCGRLKELQSLINLLLKERFSQKEIEIGGRPLRVSYGTVLYPKSFLEWQKQFPLLDPCLLDCMYALELSLLNRLLMHIQRRWPITYPWNPFHFRIASGIFSLFLFRMGCIH